MNLSENINISDWAAARVKAGWRQFQVGGFRGTHPGLQTAAAAGPRPGAADAHWNLQEHKVHQGIAGQGQGRPTHEAVLKAAGRSAVQQFLLGQPRLVVPLPLLGGPQVLQFLLLLLPLCATRSRMLSSCRLATGIVKINSPDPILLLLLLLSPENKSKGYVYGDARHTGQANRLYLSFSCSSASSRRRASSSSACCSRWRCCCCCSSCCCC